MEPSVRRLTVAIMSDDEKGGGRDLDQAQADPVSKAIHSK
jgi:hypothetical protein